MRVESERAGGDAGESETGGNVKQTSAECNRNRLTRSHVRSLSSGGHSEEPMVRKRNSQVNSFNLCFLMFPESCNSLKRS